MRALVVEGGSMRAAYANGVLAAFEEASPGHARSEQGTSEDGLRFDAAYGTSAGGAVAAWWTARQARFCAGTWHYANDRRILSWRRLVTGGAVLDHDALFRIVYETEAPLDVKAVEAAPHPLFVNAMDVETGETVVADVRKGPVLAWLRATGRMPLACGPPVEIDGRRFVDGGVGEPLLLERAIADGATDVVLVLNRPRGDREAEARAVARIVGRRYPALVPAIRARHKAFNRAQRLAYDPPPGVRVRVVRPSRDLGVGRFTRDLARIQACIDEGLRDGRAFLARAKEEG